MKETERKNKMKSVILRVLVFSLVLTFTTSVWSAESDSTKPTDTNTQVKDSKSSGKTNEELLKEMKKSNELKEKEMKIQAKKDKKQEDAESFWKPVVWLAIGVLVVLPTVGLLI